MCTNRRPSLSCGASPPVAGHLVGAASGAVPAHSRPRRPCPARAVQNRWRSGGSAPAQSSAAAPASRPPPPSPRAPRRMRRRARARTRRRGRADAGAARGAAPPNGPPAARSSAPCH
eukprot:scaffold34046_cov69-Phaeocystis_antarctica.AAC.7